MNLGRMAASRWRKALRAVRHKALILVYHRIADVEVDPWELAVRPDHFAEQLQVMRRFGWPLSLRDLVRSMTSGGIPRDAIVVTFDDGYADNLLQAKPLLEQADVSATVFLTAGSLGASRSFWWEQLTEIFLRPGTLPESLEIEIGGSVYQWTLGRAAEYGVEEARRDRGWRGWSLDPPTLRHRIYLDLFRLLQPMQEPDRRSLVARLRAWAGKGSASVESAPVLSTQEAALLASGGLIEVGAHTMTHARLSTLNDAGKRDEIHQSRKTLEEIVGQPITSFAYPYGQGGDYDDESVAIVREAGFTAACANLPGLVTRGSDVLELPRFHVSDCDGDSFARQLAGWQQR